MNHQEQINTILDNFNFEKVQVVMALWPGEWWQGKSGGVPTVEELRTLARELLETAVEPGKYNCNSVSCGGFHALCWPWSIWNGESGRTLELIFSAEDFHA